MGQLISKHYTEWRDTIGLVLSVFPGERKEALFVMDLFVWLMYASSGGEEKGETTFRYMDALALLWYRVYLIFTYIFLFLEFLEERCICFANK